MNKRCGCEPVGKTEPTEDEYVGEITQGITRLEELVYVYGVTLEELEVKLNSVLSNSEPNSQSEDQVTRFTELGDRICLVNYNLDRQIGFLKDLISRIEL